MEEQELKAAFGKVIRELRDQSRLSQQELADNANVDRSYISELENGYYNPTLKFIYKLAEILKVKPHDLIEKVDNEVFLKPPSGQ